MKKRINDGISLIALIVTITIGFVLLGVTVMKINDSIKNSSTSRFVNEIVTIKDAASSYYISENSLPISTTNSKIYTQAEFIALFDSANQEKLTQELELNGDYSTSSSSNITFYELDTSSIGIDASSRGNKKDGVKDVYYFSYPSFNIYYIRGVKIGNDIFFSYTSRIANIGDIN